MQLSGRERRLRDPLGPKKQCAGEETCEQKQVRRARSASMSARDVHPSPRTGRRASVAGYDVAPEYVQLAYIISAYRNLGQLERLVRRDVQLEEGPQRDGLAPRLLALGPVGLAHGRNDTRFRSGNARPVAPTAP